MQILFEDKKLWNIVSKTYVKPISNFVEWDKKDKKAKTIIVMGLHDFLFKNVIETKRTKETWDCLLKYMKVKV
jgi:hypothetical protein